MSEQNEMKVEPNAEITKRRSDEWLIISGRGMRKTSNICALPLLVRQGLRNEAIGAPGVKRSVVRNVRGLVLANE